MPEVLMGQIWDRKSDNRRFKVLYTIGSEAKIKYLDSGKSPYVKLEHFGRKYKLVQSDLTADELVDRLTA